MQGSTTTYGMKFLLEGAGAASSIGRHRRQSSGAKGGYCRPATAARPDDATPPVAVELVALTLALPLALTALSLPVSVQPSSVTSAWPDASTANLPSMVALRI